MVPAESWIAGICLLPCAGAGLGIPRLRWEKGVAAAVVVEAASAAYFQTFSPTAKCLIVKSTYRKGYRTAEEEFDFHGRFYRMVWMAMVASLSGLSATLLKKSLLNQWQHLEGVLLRRWRMDDSCLWAGLQPLALIWLETLVLSWVCCCPQDGRWFQWYVRDFRSGPSRWPNSVSHQQSPSPATSPASTPCSPPLLPHWCQRLWTVCSPVTAATAGKHWRYPEKWEGIFGNV